MSALPPKADICSAIAHVRLVPIADIGAKTELSENKDRLEAVSPKTDQCLIRMPQRSSASFSTQADPTRRGRWRRVGVRLGSGVWSSRSTTGEKSGLPPAMAIRCPLLLMAKTLGLGLRRSCSQVIPTAQSQPNTKKLKPMRVSITPFETVKWLMTGAGTDNGNVIGKSCGAELMTTSVACSFVILSCRPKIVPVTVPVPPPGVSVPVKEKLKVSA